MGRASRLAAASSLLLSAALCRGGTLEVFSDQGAWSVRLAELGLQVTGRATFSGSGQVAAGGTSYYEAGATVSGGSSSQLSLYSTLHNAVTVDAIAVGLGDGLRIDLDSPARALGAYFGAIGDMLPRYAAAGVPSLGYVAGFAPFSFSLSSVDVGPPFFFGFVLAPTAATSQFSYQLHDWSRTQYPWQPPGPPQPGLAAIANLRWVEAGPRTYAMAFGSNTPTIAGTADATNVLDSLSWVAPEDRFQADCSYGDGTETFDPWLTGTLQQITGSILPDDTLVFYYSGHGAGGTATWFGNVDEHLTAGANANAVSDDRLAELLGAPELADVRKVVLLDCCHAGGFWWNDLLPDADLQTISKLGLLAACGEDYKTGSADDGTGVWTNQLLPFLDPTNTWQDVASGLAALHLGEQYGYFRDEPGTLGYSAWNPVAWFSPDFDAQHWLVGGGTRVDAAAVPEPLSAAWLLVAPLAALRRRRT